MPTHRHALITGASSGLGRSLALELARRGAHVTIAARRVELLEEVAAEIAARGGSADVSSLDVRDPAAVHRVVADADAARPLDLVVANAGVSSVTKGERLAWAEVERVLDVNVRGAIATLVAGLDALRPRGTGTLVGVSSLAGSRALPRAAPYGASKAALSFFLESLAMELAGTGLRVVDVQPGFVRTPMTARNEFPMPFLMDAEPAARLIADGIEAGRAVVRFPRRLAWPLVAARLLPRGVWARLAGRFRD